MVLADARLSDSVGEPNTAGGRLNTSSRARTTGWVLGTTSDPGGELDTTSDVVGGELDTTSDSGGEPNTAGGRLNTISRARTAGRTLDTTSDLGGELDTTNDVVGGELPHRRLGAGHYQRPRR